MNQPKTVGIVFLNVISMIFHWFSVIYDKQKTLTWSALFVHQIMDLQHYDVVYCLKIHPQHKGIIMDIEVQDTEDATH